MFRLINEAIEPQIPVNAATGGIVTFEGRVRSMAEGRTVRHLEYEAYPELALVEGTALLEEATNRFGLDWANAIHRLGRLELGDTAVWIGCGAAHRREAFEACEFLIDEMKRRLPIWKKEHYADGASEWVNLQQPNVDSIGRVELFDRQMTIPEVGPAGQTALSHAKVLVVGAGGLGSACLPYLAAAGVGTLGIVEPDVLDASNIHRQVLYSHRDLGRSKVRAASERLREMHPFVQIEAVEERLDEVNAERIITGFDVVVDGTDRFDAKFLLNDVCQVLGKPLVQASIHRFDGIIQTILPGGPCLRCQWTDAPQDGCVLTCQESGVLGVVPGFFGILQANEVLKLILGYGEPLSHMQLMADLRDSSTRTLARVKRANCVCNVSQWVAKKPSLDWEVSGEQVAKWTDPFVCVDIREDDEVRNDLDLGQLEWRHAPMSRFNSKLALFPSERSLLVCSTGVRSGKLAFRLRESGMQNVFSLGGGADRAGVSAKSPH